MKNEIFIVICKDTHCDEDVKVFLNAKKAIQYCRDFVPKHRVLVEEMLTESMLLSGWIFYGTYSEDNSVRVEKSTLIK